MKTSSTKFLFSLFATKFLCITSNSSKNYIGMNLNVRVNSFFTFFIVIIDFGQKCEVRLWVKHIFFNTDLVIFEKIILIKTFQIKKEPLR